MKKIFMMAAAAALAFGVSGCNNDKTPIVGVDGTETLMGISITLPSDMGNTRQTPTEVAGKNEENAVKSLDIFVFDGNGNRPADATLHHYRWDNTSTPSFTAAFPQPSSGSTYNATVSFPTISGAVRVYVGLNLPSAFGTSGFATETALKAAASTTAVLAGSGNLASNGIVMFTDMVTGNLETVPSTTAIADLPAANKLDLEAYRTVAKLTTSSVAAANANMTVTWTPIGSITPTLKYDVKHWYVFQSGISSFVAPNYNIAQYVVGSGPTPTQPPVTQAPGGFSSTGASSSAPFYNKYEFLSDYMADGKVTEKLLVNTASSMSSGTFAAGETGASASTINAKYIGENTGITGTSWGSSTFAFISTGVTVNAAVAWDATAKAVKWEEITGEYGFGKTDATIYYIRYDNKNYITNSLTKLSDIRTGVALRDHQVVIQPDAASCNNPRPDGFIDKIASEFDSEYGFETFVFEAGYAHFPFFMGQGTTNNPRPFDVLRNQFIHLNVTGMEQTLNDGVFPGYPGQSTTKLYPGAVVAQPLNPTADSPNVGNPQVPIDISQADNNPAPHNPNEPVIQTQTAVTVTVNVNPWTYKVNNGTIGNH